jgi:hypothetical protein
MGGFERASALARQRLEKSTNECTVQVSDTTKAEWSS